jgi:flagellin-specific chaperone FliS
MAVHKQQADEMLSRIWPIVSELRASLNTEQKAKLEKKLKHWQKKGSHRG